MPDSSTIDVASYLAEKGLQVFRANGAEITMHCPFCPDGDPKGKGKCYVNTESWLYDCKRCGTTGNRKTLLRHFGDEDETAYLPGSDPSLRRKVLTEAAEIAHTMLLNNDKMMEYLVERGLSARTIIDYKLGYTPDAWPLSKQITIECAVADKVAAGILTERGYEFLRNKITIPYLSHGSCIQLRGKDPDGKYFTPSGDQVRLYNADVLRNAEDVVITEGEFDCLVLQQAMSCAVDPKVRATAVVGIAGAGALPQGFETFFTEAKRVYIALDPDETGMKAAVKIKEILGSKGRIVNLPVDLPKCDWTEFIVKRKHPLADVIELLSTSVGKRLWSVADAGAKHRRQRTEVGGIKFGWATLDSWFQPGMEPGDLIIPIAKTGVGKTNFLSNLVYNTRAYPTLMISLEMMASQVYERLRRNYHFWHPTATDDDIDEGLRLVRIVDENRLREGDISKLCDEYLDEMGVRPALTYLDYLGYYAKGCKGSGSYEKTTNAVMALKAEAKESETAVVAPHQVNRQAEDGRPLEASDARDSGAVEETADLMISLYRPADARSSGMAQGRAIDPHTNSVVRMGNLKNRKGGKGQQFNMAFSMASLVLVDDGTEASKVVVEENQLMWRGESYEAVRSYRRGDGFAKAQLTLVGVG